MEMREGKGENLLMHTFCKRHSEKVTYTEIISIGTSELILNIQDKRGKSTTPIIIASISCHRRQPDSNAG